MDQIETNFINKIDSVMTSVPKDSQRRVVSGTDWFDGYVRIRNVGM